MAKISQREKILLGYGFNSPSNSSSRRNSEVDFSDVFGGPPRCSSTQEFYNNEADNMDCHNDTDNDVESGDGGFRSSWFGLGEKPVFGDQIGVRKRYPSEDFYDDIYGGDQPLLSCSHSPRLHMPGRNPFSSAPGSRSISPSRPVSPAVQLSVTLSKFSLPGRISNTDITTSTSMNQSSRSSGRSLSRLSQVFQNHSASYSEARLSYRTNSLSRQISIDGKESTSDSNLNGAEYEAEFAMVSEENIQFHFSIYKWANKGVPIAMSSSKKRSPSRSRERMTTSERYLSTSQVDAIVNDGSLSASKRRMPSIVQVRECKSEDVITNKAPSNWQEDRKEVPDHSQKSSEATSLNSSSNITKSNLRSLGSLFVEDKEEIKITTAEKRGKESMMNETKKIGLNDVFSSYKVKKSMANEQSGEVKKEVEKSEGPAKVKDFVKKFNQESSSKVKSNVVGQSRSWRWKDSIITTFEAECDVKTSLIKDHDEMEASYASLGKTWSESIEVVVDAESYLSGELQDTITGNGSVSGTADSTSNNEPNIESVRASSTKINASSVDDSLGTGMVQDITKTESQEETMSYERKVKQWSKGKEGNIRALLSTMQYVLWPNSGWKPIPLVDIIEANAVKKSYQRALLCLHPDKLQQKGAAPYQKFIAEKVFDILQEAWEQFNSIGLL